MATIEISIKNTIHNISCNDGEEGHLQALAAKFKDKVIELSKSLQVVDDKTIYLIAGLVFLDELEDLKKAQPSSMQKRESNEGVVSIIDTIADKIENLTKKIEESIAP